MLFTHHCWLQQGHCWLQQGADLLLTAHRLGKLAAILCSRVQVYYSPPSSAAWCWFITHRRPLQQGAGLLLTALLSSRMRVITHRKLFRQVVRHPLQQGAGGLLGTQHHQVDVQIPMQEQPLGQHAHAHHALHRPGSSRGVLLLDAAIRNSEHTDYIYYIYYI